MFETWAEIRAGKELEAAMSGVAYCEECGVEVADVEAHEAWHAAQERR